MYKKTVLSLFLPYVFLIGCVNKEKKKIVVNAIKYSVAVEQDSTIHGTSNHDFDITSIEILPLNLHQQKVNMGTEKPIYSTTTKYLTIWVDNNTDIPLDIGYNWSIEFWNGKKWSAGKMKKDLFWTDIGRGSKETHIRYYFQYPIGEYYVLEQGKYRIAKTFVQEGKLIKLYAYFKVK